MRRLIAALLPLLFLSCSMQRDLEACGEGKLNSCLKNCNRGVLGEFGCRGAAEYLEAKNWREPEKHHEQQLQLYERACAGGDAPSCLSAARTISAARMLSPQKGPADHKRLRTFLSMACDHAKAGEHAAGRGLRTLGLESLRFYSCAQLGRSVLLEDPEGAQAAFSKACAHEAPNFDCSDEMENYPKLAKKLSLACAAGKTTSEWGPSACDQLRDLLDDFTRPSTTKLQELLKANPNLRTR